MLPTLRVGNTYEQLRIPVKSYIQSGTGKLYVGEFGKEAERLVDQIDRQFGKGLGM